MPSEPVCAIVCLCLSVLSVYSVNVYTFKSFWGCFLFARILHSVIYAQIPTTNEHRRVSSGDTSPVNNDVGRVAMQYRNEPFYGNVRVWSLRVQS